jgi:hypothetical protein
VKTNFQKCLSFFGSVVCLGAVLLSAASAWAQTIYAEVSNNGIYEVAGGTVTTTPISGVGTGGLAVDSSGDILFVNNNNVISEYTSGGVQQTFGLPLEPDTAPTGFTIAGIDNEGYLWGFGQRGLYSFYIYPDSAPPTLAAAGVSPATVNSAGQVFFEYFTADPSLDPDPYYIYQQINGYTVSLVYSINTMLSAMAFDNAGDLFGTRSELSPIVEFTPGGGERGVTGAPTDPTCLALDNEGDLFVGCSNGDIDEITPGGSESTVATLDGPVEGLVVVPEPSVLGLLGVGAMALILRKRLARA